MGFNSGLKGLRSTACPNQVNTVYVELIYLGHLSLPLLENV